jgi:hypothetical protein
LENGFGFLLGRKMDKKDLASLLNEVFGPLGFKRKGNYWVLNGYEITKMINLQKSQFGNRFYINYGYILRAIPLGNNVMHVFNGLGGSNKEEQERITSLLDIDTDVPFSHRREELKKLITDKIVLRIKQIDTTDDLLNELKRRPHLNDIPLVVKRYFDLK